ncbi:MAG: two-component regulator propeller domain-containing protein [Saprospiraceae bacterium]
MLIGNYCVTAQLNGKYTFSHLDQTDGLLHTSVRGIGQDKNGFIWILNPNGLQRYDGNRFVNYRTIADPSTGGMNSSELYVDTFLNQIWVIKGPSMQRLDLATDKIQTVSIEDIFNEDTLQKPEIFTELSGNRLQVSLKGTLQYEKNTNKNISGYFNLNDRQPFHQGYIIKDSLTGNFWMHNYTAVIVADAKTKVIHSSLESNSGYPLLDQLYKMNKTSNRIRYLSIDSYGNLWISTWDHILFRYNLETKILHTYSLKNIKKREGVNEITDLTLLVNAIYEDRQKNLWFGTDYAGLLKYDREKDDFNFITADDKVSNGIQYNFTIYSIFQDRDDNIWLGTDRGISIFNPSRNYFQSIRHMDDNLLSLPRQDITSVIETQQDEILVTTWGGGITVFDKRWNSIRNIQFRERNEYNLVWSSVQHDEGNIWFGAQQGYIHIFDPKAHTFSTLHPVETGFSTIPVMAKDHAGNILLGLHNGKITMWNKKENKFYAYDERSDKLNIQLPFISYIFADHRNVCWVATQSGLFEFDMNHHVYVNRYYPEAEEVAGKIIMEGIEQYNDSILIIGTKNKGIYFFNTSSRTFSRIFENDELNSSSVYAIKKDNKGNIWFTSDYSIYEWNPGYAQPIQYNIGHSTINASFISPMFIVLSDSRWVAFTPAELICFDPDQLLTERKSEYDVAICGVKVFDKKMNKEISKSVIDPVILPYHQNFISIEFSSLDFLNVRYENYYYRLSGVNADWIQSGNKQFVDYTDLMPGEYLFEVKVDNGQGPSKITSFPIIITPPWWATIWFRILVLLALGSVIWFILKNRIKTIRKESELKQRIAETETMALRAQMNPHFIFNCLNSIDNLIQTDQKAKATDYLAKFAQLIRAILENSKSNSIPCWKDLDALKLYLEMESLRWDNKINYLMNIDPQIQNGDYKVPPMAIQPFVENAIHHGLLNKIGIDKKLDIEVKLEDRFIKYTITDNGVGRLKAGQYKKLNHISRKSLGLQITSERIHLFNKKEDNSIKITDLYDTQGEPDGTKVEVWLTTQPIP